MSACNLMYCRQQVHVLLKVLHGSCCSNAACNINALQDSAL